LLIDALVLKEIALPQKSIIHGDQTSLSIAAASILAKVTRDQMMREFENDFPGYALARHKGYGTALHRAALEKLGVSPLHRRSFKPVANLLQTSEVSETSEVLESKP
jgi:ribonuclease HII